ncbi:hypothetical protein VPNG_04049 [Cytospora leucostoma]|uniref:Uncharacterized protein n=1 Tax=Cytospora leucostoma TaxID=1230097 RepID=A0A423XDM0_9PEZI|nr:hypothetical protein VPNG_04049 [Cytospora leucostoma]
MPTLAMVSKLALPASPTRPAQQRSTSLTPDDEGNVLSIVFGVLGTVIALLSFAIGYRQLIAARRSGTNSSPVGLDVGYPKSTPPMTCDAPVDCGIPGSGRGGGYVLRAVSICFIQTTVLITLGVGEP